MPDGWCLFLHRNTYRRLTFLTDADVRSALREAIGTLRLTHPFVVPANWGSNIESLNGTDFGE